MAAWENPLLSSGQKTKFNHIKGYKIMSYNSPMNSGVPTQQGPSGARVSPETEMNPLDIFLIFKRHARLIATFAAVGAVIALVFVLPQKHKYSATVTVEINPESKHDLAITGLSVDEGGLATLEMLTNELLTQESEISSPIVAIDVIKKLKLTDYEPYAIPASTSSGSPLYAERNLPLEQAPMQRDRLLALFSTNLAVSIVKGTRLLDVTYTDTDPKRAAAIANAVVATYIEDSAKSKFEATEQVSTWLTSQLDSLKKNVEDNQQKVEEYQDQNGLVGPTAGASPGPENNGVGTSPSVSIPVARLLVLNDDLTKAEVARISEEAIYRMTQTDRVDTVLGIPNTSLVVEVAPDTTFGSSGGGLNQLRELRAQQIQIEMAIKNTSLQYGPKSQDMIKLRTQQEAIQSQIEHEMASIRSRAKADFELASLTEQGLRDRVTKQEQSVAQWSSKADHLLLLQGEAAASRHLYEDLYAKLQESNLAGRINASKLTVVTPAMVPSLPSAPKKKLDVILGIFIGLVLGVIAAFGYDFLDETIHTQGEAEAILGRALLGTVPYLTDKKVEKQTPPWLSEPGTGNAQSVVGASGTVAAEALLKIRTAILVGSNGDRGLSVALVSSGDSEGRAATGYNLAAAFAQMGERTLLLDADMRRSAEFTATKAGLSDVLTGRAQPQDAIKASAEQAGLFVLPAGKQPSNPAELVSSKSFSSLVEQLKTEFTYIVIDSPPAIHYTDATLIARAAGAYLLVAREGVTKSKDLRELLEVLRQPKAALLGVVLNVEGVRGAKDGN